MQDFSTILREVSVPEVMETVFMKRLEWLETLFSKEENAQGGASITRPIKTSVTTNASTYTKADVDPVSDTAVYVDATWAKVYQHASAEVHGIDISQAMNGGQPSITNMVTKSVAECVDSLFDMIFDDIWTQVKLDIDNSGTYSTAALNRTTYPTLASQEENTDTGITLSLMRTHSNACRLNKNSGSKQDFMWVAETAVYERFEPLVAALHSWTLNDQKAGVAYAGGYQPVGSFESTPVVSPQGLTTGDIFFLRPKDLKIHYHRPLTVRQVPSGRDSAKFVAECGINGYYIYPGFAGKMTLKD